MPLTAATMAGRFAAALDAEDFTALAGLLAVDCRYTVSGDTLQGPQAIACSYQEACVWARASIQEIRYQSSVRVETAQVATVVLVDLLNHHGLAHTYTCEQTLALNADGQIQEIVHRELPGQRQAVDQYLQSIGVKRAAAEPARLQGEPTAQRRAL